MLLAPKTKIALPEACHSCCQATCIWFMLDDSAGACLVTNCHAVDVIQYLSNEANRTLFSSCIYPLILKAHPQVPESFKEVTLWQYFFSAKGMLLEAFHKDQDRNEGWSINFPFSLYLVAAHFPLHKQATKTKEKQKKVDFLITHPNPCVNKILKRADLRLAYS